ncbi:hypothetical protein GGR56DRAFT_655031 [Xylariaceae sp. FL0804]|nr:hypothetical protein GGR56DRAFT_655031 [Xylariaceae sp. FL0804]
MVALRFSSSLRALRATQTRSTPAAARRTFMATPRFQAQGYGDAKSDPVGGNPQQQPASSKTQEASEHPGPAPPDVGKGSADGASTKGAMSDSMKKAAGEGGGGEKSPEEKASAQSGGSRSKEAAETGSSPTGGEIPGSDNATHKGGEALKGPQGEGAPRPKVMNQSVPGVKSGLSDEQKQEVEAHNRDFEQKHDMANKAPEDKVNKKFWAGQGGRQVGGGAKTGGETDWNA